MSHLDTSRRTSGSIRSELNRLREGLMKRN